MSVSRQENIHRFCLSQRGEERAVLFGATAAPSPRDPLPGDPVTMSPGHRLRLFVVAVLGGPQGPRHLLCLLCDFWVFFASRGYVRIRWQKVPNGFMCRKQQIMAYFMQEM